MTNKNEIRKLEGERKGLTRRICAIELRINTLHARDEVAARKSVGAVCVKPLKKGGRK